MAVIRNSVRLALLPALLCPMFSICQEEPAPAKREVVSRVAPTYPELARRCNLRGDVRLTVSVAPDGKVMSASVAGGNPVLAEAAVNAVRNWKYAPAPHATTEQVELRFAPR
jgi:TonB family protein